MERPCQKPPFPPCWRSFLISELNLFVATLHPFVLVPALSFSSNSSSASLLFPTLMQEASVPPCQSSRYSTLNKPNSLCLQGLPQAAPAAVAAYVGLYWRLCTFDTSGGCLGGGHFGGPAPLLTPRPAHQPLPSAHGEPAAPSPLALAFHRCALSYLCVKQRGGGGKCAFPY